MKFYLIITLFLAFTYLSFGQTSSALPIPAPTNDFGASLKPGFTKNIKSSNTQKSADPGNKDVIRIETNLRVNDVMILDQKGNTINRLTKDDFIIKEDGTEQTVESFSRGNSGKFPRSIVLIIDCSLTLRPFIKTSITAAKALIDKLNPQDKMAIVTDDIKLLTDFTHDKKLLKKSLNSLEAGVDAGKVGKGAQYSALYATLNELFKEEDIRPIIIFQTDGIQIENLKEDKLLPPGLLLPQDFIFFNNETFSFNDVVTAAEQTRATIYSIIPGAKCIGLSTEAEQIKQGKLQIEMTKKYLKSLLSGTVID